MVQLDIIEDNPISLVEMQKKLKAIEKRDGQLGFRAEKTKEYLNHFVRLKLKEVQELKTKMKELEIPRLKDRHIVKIADILPEDIDSLKSLLSGETVTVKDEDLKKIIDIVTKY
ncbi:MAG: hypothetical protein ABIF40_04560 [archaeon]